MNEKILTKIFFCNVLGQDRTITAEIAREARYTMFCHNYEVYSVSEHLGKDHIYCNPLFHINDLLKGGEL